MTTATASRQTSDTHGACRPPWAVRSWPTLLWQASKHSLLLLRHVSTHITHPAEAGLAAAGQTVWAADVEGGQAALAWDWVLMPRGVVALADPMAIVTNLALIDDQGQPVQPRQMALHVNAIVHGLPWQAVVGEAVSRRQALAALSG